MFAVYVHAQRFLPSEFGLDADRSEAVEPTRSMITVTKAAIRRAVEAAGVPYTHVLAGYFFCYGLPGVGQVLAQAPPVDTAVILGDGVARVVFVDEANIAAYTVLAAGDPAIPPIDVLPRSSGFCNPFVVALSENGNGNQCLALVDPGR